MFFVAMNTVIEENVVHNVSIASTVEDKAGPRNLPDFLSSE